MRYTHPKELDDLLKDYNDVASREDRRIKLKLNEIVACYDECTVEEREFADEIVRKFCDLFELLKNQNNDCRQVADSGYEKLCGITEGNSERFISYQNKEDYVSFDDPEELLVEFYNHFIKKKSASTMKDYVARIRTFAYSERYLDKMLRSGELGISEIYIDPVLFTYENIEIILARFNTKDENGVSIKQKNNIRSALRMLNEFKTFNSVGRVNVINNITATDM